MPTQRTLSKKVIGTWLRGAGAVLCIAGLSWGIWNWYWYNSRTWWPISQSIDMSAGEKRTQPFHVNVSERFWIQIAVDRDTPGDLQMNVFGTGDPVRMQEGSGNGVEIRWKVQSDGKSVGSGSGRGKDQWMIGPKVIRRLGYFNAEKGKSYVVLVNVLQDASKLAPYHPRVQVQVDGFDIDGYAIGYGIMELFGFAAAAIGLIIFIVGWTVLRHHRAADVVLSNAR